MKRFKKFIKESDGTPLGATKPQEKEVDKVKLKQKQDKDSFSDRQYDELASAKKRDFDKAEQESRAKEAEKKNKERAKDSIKEVLEDGTDELVDEYAEYVPGQDPVNKTTTIKEASKFEMHVTFANKIQFDRVVKSIHGHHGRGRVESQKPDGSGVLYAKFDRLHHLESFDSYVRSEIKVKSAKRI